MADMLSGSFLASFEEAATNMLIDSQLYIYSFLIKLGLFLTLWHIVCYVFYIGLTILRDINIKSRYFNFNAKNVLIVIAHPDDECMFFGPVIVSLVRKERTVHVLCLSNGDAENKGHLREQELYDSCGVLGVRIENIKLSCCPSRQDGQQYEWKTDNIASVILDYVDTFSIDTVITFDNGGVSGHQNHISLFRTACSLIKEHSLNCRIFTLDSTALLRKYSSVMDCLVSFIVSDNVITLSPNESELVRQAMRKHKTQYVWYRKLYLYFSRYIYVNTFTELITLND